MKEGRGAAPNPAGGSAPRPAQGVAFLLCLLALVSQIALGAMVLPDTASASPAVQLRAMTVLCRAGAPAPHGPEPAGHRHTADLAICPIGMTLALHAGLPSPTAVLPSRRIVATTCVWTPLTARGPPADASCVGFPRGPPVPA